MEHSSYPNGFALKQTAGENNDLKSDINGTTFVKKMGENVTDFNKVLEGCFKFCIHQQINCITKGINQYMSQINA